MKMYPIDFEPFERAHFRRKGLVVARNVNPGMEVQQAAREVGALVDVGIGDGETRVHEVAPQEYVEVQLAGSIRLGAADATFLRFDAAQSVAKLAGVLLARVHDDDAVPEIKYGRNWPTRAFGRPARGDETEGEA